MRDVISNLMCGIGWLGSSQMAGRSNTPDDAGSSPHVQAPVAADQCVSLCRPKFASSDIAGSELSAPGLELGAGDLRLPGSCRPLGPAAAMADGRLKLSQRRCSKSTTQL